MSIGTEHYYEIVFAKACALHIRVTQRSSYKWTMHWGDKIMIDIHKKETLGVLVPYMADSKTHAYTFAMCGVANEHWWCDENLVV